MTFTEVKDVFSSAGIPKQTAENAGMNHPRLRFLKTTDCAYVSYWVLVDIGRAMEQAGIHPIYNPQSKGELFVAEAFSRLRWTRNIRRSPAGPVFAAFMGFSEGRTLPFSFWTEVVPYCFDCWPNRYDRWMSFFKRQRVRIAFFSARQSAEHFAKALPNMKSVWLPEATDPSEYCPSKSWSERDIDVLELGRKNNRFHRKIAEPLAKGNKVHLFERVAGEIIFPDRDALVQGLARSKISTCFPSSQTHPERAGSVETVTHRYFESMASKCLIIGHAPRELTDLFGYNPVIEVEEGREFEQIDSLLSNLESYADLIEKNYNRLLQVGTWKSRVANVLDTIREISL